MPITSARTSPPSGLLSCSVLAARALSRRTPDAEIKAMVNIIFQDAGIAHFLNKIPTSRAPSKPPASWSRGRTYGPDAPRPNLWTTDVGDKHSCSMPLTRFTVLPCPVSSNARLASPTPDRHSPKPSSRPRPGRGNVLGRSRAPKVKPVDRRCDRPDRCSHQLTTPSLRPCDPG